MIDPDSNEFIESYIKQHNLTEMTMTTTTHTNVHNINFYSSKINPYQSIQIVSGLKAEKEKTKQNKTKSNRTHSKKTHPFQSYRTLEIKRPKFGFNILY